MQIGSYEFAHVCTLFPEFEAGGSPRAFLPQAAYTNRAGLDLHEFGSGPFCKVSIPKNLRKSGVYALTVDGEVRYVGLCVNLSSRYNAGYGQISPRNCYSGGQSTNCRINNLMYRTWLSRSKIDLWFVETADYVYVEAELLEKVKPFPKWNKAKSKANLRRLDQRDPRIPAAILKRS